MKEKIYIPIEIENMPNNDEIGKKIEENNSARKILQIKNKDFTSINIEKQKEILIKLNELIKEYRIFGIKITSEPDSIDKNNLKLLKKYKVKEIELNIDSSNDYILKNVGADYNLEIIKKVTKLIKQFRIELSVKIAIGLPESTLVDDLNTIKQVMKLRPIQVSLIPCNSDYNKYVNELYETEEFIPLSKVQLVERIKDIIFIGEDKQYIEEMPISQFRKLVASEIWYEKIIEQIKSYNVKVKEVEIEVNAEDKEDVIGINNKNLEQLKDIYDVNLNVIANNKVKRFNYKMKILKTYTDFLEENDN